MTDSMNHKISMKHPMYMCRFADYEKQLTLGMASGELPDLVILDLGLPDMDGMDILRQLRSWSSLPVVVVSARSYERDKVTALDLGADDYLTKPFGTDELLARVRTAIRHTRTPLPNGDIAQSGQFRAMGLVIDYDKHQVTVDGEPVKMTPIEYNILLLLVKNAGKVFSIDEIYEQIWNEEAIGADNTVAVHIRHIREKIEINPREPRYLKVVWGVGYKIEKQ